VEAPPREAYDHPASLDAAAALGPVNVITRVVAQGVVATPFGNVPAEHIIPGTAAQCAVRAESLSLSPGQGARVVDVRPHGAHDVVRIEAQGVIWRALVPARTELGETVTVSIQPAGAFVFAD